MRDPTAKPPPRALPIAGHLAMLVTIALFAAHLATFLVVIVLPAKPPDLVRSDQVLERFEAGFAAAAKSGKAPQADALARFSLEPRAPARRDGPHRWGHRFAERALATKLNLAPEKVAVSFGGPPRQSVVVQLRSEYGPKNLEERKFERHFEEMMPDMPPDRLLAPPPPEAFAMGPGFGPPPGDLPPPIFAPAPAGFFLMANYVVSAQLPSGKWLVMRQRRNAEEQGWMLRLGLAIGGTLALLLAVALLFARRIALPIRRFALAVQRVGVEPQASPVPEHGPRELRIAARAVNDMQSRLRGLVAQRTEMLAAVAHDMRTPLMRMRLVAESADPALRDRIAKEAAEIDALVGSFIAFARDDPTREARVKLDLAALVQSVADDRAEAGQRVRYAGPERLVLHGQPMGLKRLVDNLIDNAVKYGGAAQVSVEGDGAAARIVVDDEGPGIPVEERDKVFRPFVRGAAAAQTAGAGLGLAAVLDIARAHGGDVAIDTAPSGGARVAVTLPM